MKGFNGEILSKNRIYFENIDWSVKQVGEEMRSGLELINGIDQRIITFFGSHKSKPGTEHYDDAKKLAFNLAKNGNTIMSGGGPGIMEAANCGAKEAGGESIGVRAKLIADEQVPEGCFTKEIGFHFMLIRRFILAIKSEVLVFYPGGYGTLNELFEYTTLMQVNMVNKRPIIVVNRDYWHGLFEWIKNNPLKEDYLKHDLTDMDLIKFADDHKEAEELISSIDAKI